MARIDLTAALQKFKEQKPTGTHQEFRDLFYLRRLPLWCDDYKIEDVDEFQFEINAETSRVTVWPRSGAWGKLPDAYRFETDSELLEKLLTPDNKHAVKAAIEQEAFRRQQTNEPVNAGVLHRWAANNFPAATVPTKRSIQTWLYEEWGFPRS